MGLCSAKTSPEEEAKLREDKRRSRELEKVMSKDHALDQQVNKLLLLGAGESGKSTLFKQMISIYGKGWSATERGEYTNIIYANIVASMKTLCEQSEELKTKIKGTSVSRQNAASKRSEERFSRNAETDLVCRLLLEKKKKD
eukprot:TRINITY_DN673_c0_g1_i1.p1 TRINITY_DN673_c0_g1~~TRINITY_DN673_c0_g1_i1.p1  ORF type:complete len:142 (-),score=22.28 TRINITY_DN673_c0_g1_i1:9-434(-)